MTPAAGARRWLPAAAAIAIAAGPAAAQHPGAGTFVPVGSRLDALALHAQAAGAFRALDPLTRPWRIGDLRQAVDREDTLALTPSGRQAVRWVAGTLARHDSTIAVAELALQAYANGRRESLRWSDSGAVTPAAGLRVELTRGPFVAVLNPAFDNRLKHDPEWTGYTDRTMAGRIQEAYVGVTGAAGDLTFGRMARNWGPPLFDGLQFSPSAYPRDGLAGSLRIGRFALTSVAERLDDADTTAAITFQRWLAAHRLSVDLGRGAWVGLTETAVYGGRGQGFDPSLHAPLGVALVAQYNEGRRMNSMLGVDALVPLTARVRLALAVMLDDIQVHDSVLTDDRPTSYAATGTLTWAAAGAPLQAALGYTRVSALAYRNSFDPFYVHAVRDVGIARNFADYDQALARVAWRPRMDLGATLDLSVIRQGAGDFRLPFPPDSVLSRPGQGFLTDPVRTMPGARFAVDWWSDGGLRVRAQAGTVRDAGGTWRPIAALTVAVRGDLLARRLGGAVSAIELP